MYRHALFFTTCAEAEATQAYVQDALDGLDSLAVEEIGVFEDHDERTIFELRFYTNRKLDRYEESMLLDEAKPNSYEVNSEA